MAEFEISPVVKLIEDALVEIAKLEDDSEMNGFQSLQLEKIKEDLEIALATANKI